MHIKDILVCLDLSERSEVRLGLALSLAAVHGACLTGINVLPRETGEPAMSLGRPVISGMPVMGPGPIATPVDAVIGRADEPGRDAPRPAEMRDQMEVRFRAELNRHGIPGQWSSVREGDLSRLVGQVRVVDLTIVGQRDSRVVETAGIAVEEIIVAGGRPVLVVPSVGTFETVGRHVLVAWDGTREAARALHDGLPLMAKADSVTVIVVDSPDESAPDRASAEACAAHLGRHGICAEVNRAPRGDLGTSELILSRAADLGADLIVCGAFHHSRFRERLLGGVSRDLLDHMTVPVLMSH